MLLTLFLYSPNDISIHHFYFHLHIYRCRNVKQLVSIIVLTPVNKNFVEIKKKNNIFPRNVFDVR